MKERLCQTGSHHQETQWASGVCLWTYVGHTYLNGVYAEKLMAGVEAGCIKGAVSAMHDGAALDIVLSGWGNIVIVITGEAKFIPIAGVDPLPQLCRTHLLLRQ